MSQFDTVVHLVAGGVGGTAGAILTCPLEVVKTRLQSSVATFHLQQHLQASASSPSPSSSASEHVARHLRSAHQHHHVYVPRPLPPSPSFQQQQHRQPPRFQISTVCTTVASSSRAPEGVLTFGESTASTAATTASCRNAAHHNSIGIWKCLRYIIETEGTLSLFKGLGPNLVGVAPSRAIYFCTYSNAKSLFNQQFTPESPLVHMSSAVCAGFSASTATNPIWFVKTRLQLDQRKKGGLTAVQCIGDIYRTKGIRGFYKGIAASYFGISETVIHLVVYEAIKAKLRNDRSVDVTDEKTTRDFVEFMMAGAMSKTFASVLAYPHEVARTRLRQEGDKYRSFWQTLATVFHEEGHRGLYRGLATQLIRQIPNTAIVMATYELVVHLLGSRSNGLTLSSPSSSQQRSSAAGNGHHHQHLDRSDDDERHRRQKKETGD